MRLQGRPHHTQAVPADEGTEELDAIGRMNLALDRRSDRRLAASVDEQVGRRERHKWLRRVARERGTSVNRLDFPEQRQGHDKRVVCRDRIRSGRLAEPGKEGV